MLPAGQKRRVDHQKRRVDCQKTVKKCADRFLFMPGIDSDEILFKFLREEKAVSNLSGNVL